VSLLEPVLENNIPGRIKNPPPPIILDNQEEYEIENIIDSRVVYNKQEYLVDWKGYNISDRTWEPKENLGNSQELIERFHKRYPDKPRIRSAHP